MPGLAEQFVEAEVVNDRVQTELRIGSGRECRYIYGVRFRRVVSDAATLEQFADRDRSPVRQRLKNLSRYSARS